MVDRWLQLPESICLLPLWKNTSMPNYTNNVGKSALLRYHLFSANGFVRARSFQSSAVTSRLFLVTRLHLKSSAELNRRLSARQSIDGGCCRCFPLCSLTIWRTFLPGLCENDCGDGCCSSTVLQLLSHQHPSTGLAPAWDGDGRRKRR